MNVTRNEKGQAIPAATILPADIPALDAILITHDDNDHFSKPTCHDVKDCMEFHAPHFVAGLIRDEGLNGIGHDIGETFSGGDMKITLTPGDSRLLQAQLEMPQPDADLILIHWGSVDAPNMNTFNGDPEKLAAAVVNPERVHALAPGEKFALGEKQ